MQQRETVQENTIKPKVSLVSSEGYLEKHDTHTIQSEDSSMITGAFLDSGVLLTKGDVIRFVGTYVTPYGRSQMRLDFEVMTVGQQATVEGLVKGFQQFLEENILPIQTDQIVWKKLSVSILGKNSLTFAFPVLGWRGKISSETSSKPFQIQLIPVIPKLNTKTIQTAHQFNIQGVTSFLKHYQDFVAIYNKTEEILDMTQVNSLLFNLDLNNQLSSSMYVQIMSCLTCLQNSCVYEFPFGNTKFNVRFVRIARIGRPKLDTRKVVSTKDNGIVVSTTKPGVLFKEKEKEQEKEQEQQLMSKQKTKPNLTRISKDQIIRFHYAIASGIKN